MLMHQSCKAYLALSADDGHPEVRLATVGTYNRGQSIHSLDGKGEERLLRFSTDTNPTRLDNDDITDHVSSGDFVECMYYGGIQRCRRHFIWKTHNQDPSMRGRWKLQSIGKSISAVISINWLDTA